MDFTLVVGCIFFPSAYLITKRILEKLFPAKLTVCDQYFIAEKCVNSLQAVMSTGIGIIISRSCHGNIMYDTHWLTNFYAAFALPYFLYDVWAMYNTQYYLDEAKMSVMNLRNKIVHYTMCNKAMLIHHLILPVFFYPSILYFRNNKGDYFVGILYTCEAAIPFISLRFILSQLQMKDSILYVFAGLLMIIVFFIVRVCIFIFLFWKYSIYAGISLFSVPFSIPLKCNLGCLCILLIQIYFLYLMIRGAARAFNKMYKRSKKR